MSSRPSATPPRVMVIARAFPNRVTAGNMTYVDAIVEFLEREGLDLRLVVLGDRFPNNEFFYRYPEAPHRLARLSFRQGTGLGAGLALKGLRPIVKNAVRRTVLALPPRVTSAVKSWYFKVRQVSTEDWFTPLAPADLAHAIREIEVFRPDHVFIDSFLLSDVIEACGHVAFTSHLIMHDLVSARVASLGRAAGAHADPQTAILAERATDLAAIEREELRRMALFDSILAIQRAEANYVAARLPDKNVLYVPMPAQPAPRSRARAPLTRRVLFVGSSGQTNMQGIDWLLNQVWPVVLAQCPAAQLDVCGTCCDYLSRSNTSVRLHGRVTDLGSFYEQADACVVPLLAGSGMKIKLVEALSHGAACVTTTAGMQGLEEGAGSAFVHTDAADDFARAVVTLMNEMPVRDRLRRSAAAFARQRFSPSVVFADLARSLAGPQPIDRGTDVLHEASR